MSLESVRPAVSLERREADKRTEEFSSLKRIKDAGVSFARIASHRSFLSSPAARANSLMRKDFSTDRTLRRPSSLSYLKRSITTPHRDRWSLRTDTCYLFPSRMTGMETSISSRQNHTGRSGLLSSSNNITRIRKKTEMASATSQEKIQELQDIEESQSKIYAGLKNLSNHGVVHSVCSEGVINDDPTDAPSDIVSYQRKHGDISVLNRLAAYDTSMEALKNDYDAALSTFDPERHASSAEKDRALQTLNTLESNIHAVVKPYPLVNGAAKVLAAEGSISLCGAENRATYDRSWSPTIIAIAEEKFSDPEHRAVVTKAVMTDREDAALKNALAEPGDGVAIVYGAAHDFSRTTAEYNLTHPASPIALVIVDAFVYHPTPTDISSPRSTENP